MSADGADDLPEPPPPAGAAAADPDQDQDPDQGPKKAKKKKKKAKKKKKNKSQQLGLCRLRVADGAAGRVLVAARDVQAGEVVLREPALAFAALGGRGAVCCVCARPADGEPCPGGCGSGFCGAQCRALGGPRHDEALCAALARADAAAAAHDADAGLLAAVLALRAARAAPWPRPSFEEDDDDALPVASWAEFEGLLAHEEAFDDEWRAAVRAALAAVGVPEAEAEDALRIACRVNTNAHAMVGPGGAPVALGMFPRVAMINHSCHNNCLYTASAHRMEVRAVRDVPEGAELTIAYTAVYRSTAARVAALRRERHFDCVCERCAAGAGDEVVAGVLCGCGAAHAEARLPASCDDADACGCDGAALLQRCREVRRAAGEALQAAEAGNAPAPLEAALRAMDGVLAPGHELQLRAHKLGVRVARATGDAQAALRHAERVLECLGNGIMPPNSLEAASYLALKASLLRAVLRSKPAASRKVKQFYEGGAAAAEEEAGRMRAVCGV